MIASVRRDSAIGGRDSGRGIHHRRRSASPRADDGGDRLPDTEELQQGTGQVLLSRRQILTGTSIGIGATLLFHQAARNRVDLPAARPQPSPAAVPPAPQPARRRQQARDQRGDAVSGGDAPQRGDQHEQAATADGDGGADGVNQRAIHRAQLSDHGMPHSVCKGDAGVLVVGMSTDGDPLGWVTDDGSVWLEHTLAPADRDRADVWGVTAHDGQFIAVGSTVQRDVRRIVADGIVSDGDAPVTYVETRRSPTVWISSDGGRWSGRSFDDVVGPHADLTAVAGNGERLVAVGRTFDVDGVTGTGGLVLTSTDGRSWRRADLGPAADWAEGSFTAVDAGEDGRWYAASVDIDGAAIWTSTDGLRWSVIESSRRTFRGLTLQGLAVDGDRLLAAGTSLIDPQPKYFVSRTGGRSWKPATLDVSLLAGRDARIGDLSVISGDVVVVGTLRDAPVLEGGDLYVRD